MPLGLWRGNLVQNGGFERGLADWLGVTNVDLESSPLCHEGLLAAAMGKPDNAAPADMFQDVPVAPRHTYKLGFFAAGVETNPGDLVVDVRWIGYAGDIGCALAGGPVLVRGDTTGRAASGAWKAVITYTESAPPGAETARICLVKAPGTLTASYLLVDDVVLVQRD